MRTIRSERHASVVLHCFRWNNLSATIPHNLTVVHYILIRWPYDDELELSVRGLSMPDGMLSQWSVGATDPIYRREAPADNLALKSSPEYSHAFSRYDSSPTVRTSP